MIINLTTCKSIVHGFTRRETPTLTHASTFGKLQQLHVAEFVEVRSRSFKSTKNMINWIIILITQQGKIDLVVGFHGNSHLPSIMKLGKHRIYPKHLSPLTGLSEFP